MRDYLFRKTSFTVAGLSLAAAVLVTHAPRADAQIVIVPPPIVAPVPSVDYAPPMAQVTTPAPVSTLAPPSFRPQLGLGLRGLGIIDGDKTHAVGGGGEILFRASPHWTLELAAEYQRNLSAPVTRLDVPVTFGARLHLARPTSIVSPYLVGAMGVDFGTQIVPVNDVIRDRAYLFEGQVGGGLELRAGRSFAITADARLVGRKRLDTPDVTPSATTPTPTPTPTVDGKPIARLGNQYGTQFRLGLAAYF